MVSIPNGKGKAWCVYDGEVAGNGITGINSQWER